MECFDENDFLSKLFPLEKMSKCIREELNENENKKHGKSTLIIGPQDIRKYKMSLLFQVAVSHCETSRSGVLFIMQKPMSDLPNPIHGMSRPTKSNMTHLQFAYIDGSSEFIKFLTSFHELRTTANFNPTLICIDGLDHYLEQHEEGVNSDNDKYLAKILALLQDIAYFSTLKGKSLCRLVVSCAKTEFSAIALNILKHFFDCTWKLLETKIPESEKENHGSNSREKRFILNKVFGWTTVVESVTFEHKNEEICLLSLKNKKIK